MYSGWRFGGLLTVNPGMLYALSPFSNLLITPNKFLTSFSISAANSWPGLPPISVLSIAVSPADESVILRSSMWARRAAAPVVDRLDARRAEQGPLFQRLKPQILSFFRCQATSHGIDLRFKVTWKPPLTTGINGIESVQRLRLSTKRRFCC